MPDIKFIKVERDCPANKTTRKEQAALPEKWKTPRGIIYDYDIIIDGVKRGVWNKNSGSIGYRLMDSSNRPVRAPYFDTKGRRRIEDKEYNWHQITANTQGQFEEEVLKELDYIPTIQQVIMRDALEETKRIEAEAAEVEKWRIIKIKEHGVELLAALEAANRLFVEALPKFDWGASALDANAIQLLNEVPGQVRNAIKLAKGE